MSGSKSESEYKGETWLSIVLGQGSMMGMKHNKDEMCESYRSLIYCK
jgi:hypothetical protein